MGKLLSASMARTVKDKVFWVCVTALSVLVAYVCVQNYLYQMRYNTPYGLDMMLFGYNLFIPIQCAVFCSMFLGTEYADGTIRNKLVVGHTRRAVYLSNVVTAFVASVLMSLACFVVCLAMGVPLFGGPRMGVGWMLTILLGSLCMTAAICAICTACAMLIHKKAVLVLVLVLGMVALMLAAIAIQGMLEAPEFYPYAMDMVDGELVTRNDVPNPHYLTGAKRAFYQFLYDFLPTGQARQYHMGEAAHPWRMCLYSIAITVVTTIAGLAAFRRKDIK